MGLLRWLSTLLADVVIDPSDIDGPLYVEATSAADLDALPDDELGGQAS